METPRRPTPRLRRVAMMAALAALLVPAGQAEAAKKKVAKPVVTRVAPMNANIGDTLTIYGRHFRKGKGRNSVAFKRDGAAAVFIKSDVSTLRQIKVELSDKLASYLLVKDGLPVPTVFRVRVLANRFGAKFTAASKSPKIGPRIPEAAQEPPAAAADGDCDGDDVKNGVDPDDDNDLLGDGLEKTLKTDQCNRDTDGDGIEDGYEFQSSRDLNDDLYGNGTPLPAPYKQPYANALQSDAAIDYDGDGLELIDEYRLWAGYGQHKTSDGAPLSSLDTAQRLVLNYSDGKQYTENVATVGYAKQAQFLASAAAKGIDETSLLNMNGLSLPADNVDSPFNPGADDYFATDGVVTDVERYYYDADLDGKLSDNERDEDADGLSNWIEAHGFMNPKWWGIVYPSEKDFVVSYRGTDLADGDTDGDGIVDGADDADHDDIPNVRELRRQLVAGEPHGLAPWVMGADPAGIVWNRPQEGAPASDPLAAQPYHAWVQPFNPCLPDVGSRTCERYPSLGALYPPFDADAPMFNVFDGTTMNPS
jgi:hypothetical protein